MPRTIRSALVVAVLAVTAVVPGLDAPSAGAGRLAPYEDPAAYPDAPPAGPASASTTALVRGGQDEEANWVPFLGNHELWCTNGNPGYSGCRGHHGYLAIDIGMPVGTRIYSPGPGTIAAAGSSGDARGVYVEIRHDDGISSRYYHLSSEQVRVGQRVERGTPIARSGNTGRTSSPHLHYEERDRNGNLKDPGVMFGMVGGALRAYPSDGRSWWVTPYGTRIRNQGFAVDNTSLYWGGPGVATGDFDGDGVDDVAVGIPGEDTNRTVNTIDNGAVHVLYGSGGAEVGLGTGGESIVQGWPARVPGTRQNNEVFGAALAVGDFDGDGVDDLAMGAPAATVSGQRAAGEVVVLRGSAEGLLPAVGPQLLTGVAPERGDQFGAALTTGDFDGDGDDELVVGAPGEGLPPGRAVAGAVTVFDGSVEGLSATGRELHAGTAGVAGDPESGDRLGVSVAAGDLDGDGLDDLAVGVPGEDTLDQGGGVAGDAGAVLLLRGRSAEGPRPGLRGDGSQELHADSPGVVGDGRTGDQLGLSLAVGDVHGDGFADVVAGAIGRDVGGKVDAGVLLVLGGSAAGVRPSGVRQFSLETPGAAGAAARGDRLGASVAVEDLDGDGAADIVAGAPGKNVARSAVAGAVLVLPGGEAGPTGLGSRLLHAGTATTGLPDRAEAGDALGAGVAVGDLDGNGFGDLVLAATGEDLGGVVDIGAVTVVYGSGSGLATSTASVAHRGNVGLSTAASRTDRFGGLFPVFLR